MSAVRLAHTGGPCGGKSTFMGLASKAYGNRVEVMPEVASMLLSNGFPRPGEDVEYSERWLYALQHSILPVQQHMEDQYLQKCLERASRLLAIDRGILDCAVYLGKGLEFFLDYFDLDLAEVYARYDAVLHFESVAVSDPRLYADLKATNPARYEDPDAAASLDIALKTVWQDHPNWILIPGNGGMDAVISQGMGVYGRFLSQEIEAKYWLPAMPDISLPEGLPVSQAYVLRQPEMRVRKIGNQHYVTVKEDGTHSRRECERTIDAWVFDALRAQAGAVVEKTRYLIPHGGRTLELDVYHGPLEGLVTLECEFRSLAELRRFTPPDLFGEAIDVTEDSAFKNRSLAFSGLPDHVRRRLTA